MISPDIFGRTFISDLRIPKRNTGFGMVETLCLQGPPAADQKTLHAAALRGISRWPLEAWFSSGSSHDSILKLVFAAADC